MEIREKEKKRPKVIMSRRCVLSLNKIGQKEVSENRRRKKCREKEEGRVLGAYSANFEFEFGHALDMLSSSSRSARVQNIEAMRKQELRFRRARKSAIL